MNKVILMGRLTRDPEIRYSTGEKSMCIARFSIAVDRRQKGKDGVDADFIPQLQALVAEYDAAHAA